MLAASMKGQLALLHARLINAILKIQSLRFGGMNEE
jgi:hypothetical protein